MLEKRWAMPDRKLLVATLGLATSLALLALVLVASIRLPGFVATSSHPDYLRDNLILTPGQPATCLVAAEATGPVRESKALLSKNEQEEEEADAFVEPRASFLILCSAREAPERRLIVPRSILSLYHLRC
jgi:hypothetical protein